jgi:heterodisulfide reductase subunit A
VRYDDIDQLEVRPDGAGGHLVVFTGRGGGSSAAESDIVVLCPAIVPSEGTARMAQLLEVGTDRFGFLEELHGRMDSVRSKVRGICIAGACQAPMDTQKAVEQALAASGVILSGLVPGRKLVIEPVVAVVDSERCSACRSCVSVCPYKAIAFDSVKDSAMVDSVLCLGCGTCVAACPAGAIKGNHFTNEQLFGEIAGVLS